jgi:hypothetical protein
MTSTKQTKHRDPLLTRRAALTKPPGVLIFAGDRCMLDVRRRAGYFGKGGSI